MTVVRCPLCQLSLSTAKRSSRMLRAPQRGGTLLLRHWLTTCPEPSSLIAVHSAAATLRKFPKRENADRLAQRATEHARNPSCVGRADEDNDGESACELPLWTKSPNNWSYARKVHGTSRFIREVFDRHHAVNSVRENEQSSVQHGGYGGVLLVTEAIDPPSALHFLVDSPAVVASTTAGNKMPGESTFSWLVVVCGGESYSNDAACGAWEDVLGRRTALRHAAADVIGISSDLAISKDDDVLTMVTITAQLVLHASKCAATRVIGTEVVKQQGNATNTADYSICVAAAAVASGGDDDVSPLLLSSPAFLEDARVHLRRRPAAPFRLQLLHHDYLTVDSLTRCLFDTKDASRTNRPAPPSMRELYEGLLELAVVHGSAIR